MAGEGLRFKSAGYLKPKPFINANGRMLIEIVLENLLSDEFELQVVLIARKSHIADNFKEVERILARGNVEIFEIAHPTEGSLSTLLEAQSTYDDEIPLLVANSDQFVDFHIDDFLKDSINRDLDGNILVFRDESRDRKWSFAALNEDGFVSKVAEKNPISNLATVGIYYFSSGHCFIDKAKELISSNDRTNNEFYTCPVYNYLIKDGKKVGVYEISESQMFGLGTPEDLESYLMRKE